MQPHRRTSLFADKRFQIRASLYVCGWLAALSVVYLLIAWNLFGYFIRATADNSWVISVGTLESTRAKVIVLLIALQILLIAGAFLTSIFVTHRIVGPLVKLQNLLREVGQGDVDQRLQLRRNDLFQELADSYNQMIDGIRSRFGKN
jgi:methyl-accepting chemotaxis protein